VRLAAAKPPRPRTVRSRRRAHGGSGHFCGGHGDLYSECVAIATRDAAREADRIRTSAWGTSFPVDPALIAQRLGVVVRRAPLSPDVSGALVKRLGADPEILLNANDHPNRQRFTCAHELGHFVSRENDPNAYEYVDLRDTIFSASGIRPDEVYANTFAANLLMPESEVKRLKEKRYTATEMALYFGVSQDAMSFRLKNLNFDT
jgi:Zn-dependent peptidase ImmA (M78 family)